MKAQPFDWVSILKDLNVLPGGWYLSNRVVFNYLLTLWWDFQFMPENGPVYLPFQPVHFTTGGFIAGQVGSPGFKHTFGHLYHSVAPYAKHRIVCFFLYRNSLVLATNN
jgi:hypothetical protein